MNTKELSTMLQEAVRNRYGNNIPSQISARLEEEWDFIQSQKIENEFIRACDITDKLKQHQMPWIIMGAESGSSLIAFLLGITQVNPLPPHYYCPKCKKVEFISGVKSGFDLPGKTCTSCGTAMLGDGHQISFLWFSDTVPSLGLPLFSEYRVPDSASSVMGEISSVCDLPIVYNGSALEHKSVIRFNSATTFLRHLQLLCRKIGLTEEKIPVNDTEALRCLFEWLEEENIEAEASDFIYNLILLFYDTYYEEEDKIRQELVKNASVFSDLVQLSGLYNMTLDDEYELPQELWTVFCDRESVFEYFFQHGIPTETAFELAQSIRKGKHLEEVQVQLKSFSIDPTVIEAVKHIRYLFPRSHAVCFGMLQIRLVWLCLHYSDECRQALVYEEWADVLELIKAANDKRQTDFWELIKVMEDEKWIHVLSILKLEIPEIIFNTWFKSIKVESVDTKFNMLYLTTDSDIAANLINERYRSILESTIKLVYGNHFDFTIK